MTTRKLFLFDVMPLLYRAHFATMGKRFGTTTGIDTRTPLVFFNYIFQVLLEEKPDAVAAALDSKPKQRSEVSAVYKANRQKMPSEISAAFPYALRLLEALGIPVLKEEGHEADDIIAAIARKGAGKGYEVYIVSPDKDLAQLVNPHVFLFRPAYKGAAMETLDAAGVKAKFGVEPAQIADYLALRGDSVDNIAGVKGVGDKTAAQLLQDHPSVEALLEHADQIKSDKVREAIVAARDQLLDNKKLTLLSGEMEMEIDWERMRDPAADPVNLLPLLDELQFEKMKERLVKLGFLEAGGETAPAAETTGVDVTEFTAEKVLDKVQKAKAVSIAYLEEHPDNLFVVAGETHKVMSVKLESASDWKKLIAALDHTGIAKTGWLLKPLLKKLEKDGIILKTPWVDLSLAAYLLEPDAKIEWRYVKDKYSLAEYRLQGSYQNLDFLPSLPEAAGKILGKIKEMGLDHLFYDIELPLESVITAMELQGIRIDLSTLEETGRALRKQLTVLEHDVYEAAGSKFNLGSTSKTAEVLQKIADPSELKKTKTGQISTAEPFLIDLAPKYPFIAHLLNYRKLNRIISNYVESLPEWVHPGTKKIHPVFQQLVAATGRLTCTDPNLQNLPARSEAGREVRKAIVASTPGYSILSVDYNQVELRLLASLSKDHVLVDAFRSGKDIHTITASRLFHVTEKEVTKDMRSKAKAVNFGIAYGITPWGIASRLKIPQQEAKTVIDTYFEEFSSVKAYLDQSVLESRERGYTRTLYGRIRFIEGLDSKNGTTRKAAERTAVNAPLQGLAADIIKEAMVSIGRIITEKKLHSRMILQVHDELVFDAADEELPVLIPDVVRIMETKAELLVPLKVDVSTGKNWLDQEEYNVKG